VLMWLKVVLVGWKDIDVGSSLGVFSMCCGLLRAQWICLSL
jgi:hypothetical protein